MKGKDLLSVSDLSSEEVDLLLSDTMSIKTGGWLSSLSGRSLALLFEKPSLRTRISFEMAMCQLGGQVIYLSPDEVGLGRREPVADVARVISRYVDVIAVRTNSHQTLELLAEYASVPVINALSDREHPCQALADLFTIYEKKGYLNGLNLAFIGDGNNVANSLLLATSLVGMNFRIASPAGYQINDEIMSLARDYAGESGSDILCTRELEQAVAGADIVYTDVWTSMGQEDEAEKRRRDFAGYQVNGQLLDLAKDDVILMHPLPAHRGDEVTDDVLDGPASVVFDQAENRLHLAKALLDEMLGGLEFPLSSHF